MKKSRLLNSELSYEIAKIGHTAHITLCDAGLPIPQSVKRIDLAVEAGLPGFINVLDPVLSEIQVCILCQYRKRTKFSCPGYRRGSQTSPGVSVLKWFSGQPGPGHTCGHWI